jgi:anti-sigma-K factor RskA
VFELWVKLADRPTVDSLGLISADGIVTLDLSEELANAIASAEFLGVSVEPPGGSPTGQPTTTPSYAGTLVQI